MRLSKIIIDADFCIKVGASSKYRYLELVLPLLATKAYIHEIVYREIIVPLSVKEQLQVMIKQGFLEIISEDNLNHFEKIIYDNTYLLLAGAMMNPTIPNKNKGETCSLAMAKAKSIPYFVTDEKDLQPIIDKLLNTEMEHISCVRIKDVISKIKSGEINGLSRKDAKILWVLSNKDKSLFDNTIWPTSS
jgi:hypothetical protein